MDSRRLRGALGGIREGFADTSTDNVEKLAGHPPRDFERFARDFRQTWE
jgi:hypothetical protein